VAAALIKVWDLPIFIRSACPPTPFGLCQKARTAPGVLWDEARVTSPIFLGINIL